MSAPYSTDLLKRISVASAGLDGCLTWHIEALIGLPLNRTVTVGTYGEDVPLHLQRRNILVIAPLHPDESAHISTEAGSLTCSENNSRHFALLCYDDWKLRSWVERNCPFETILSL